MHAKREWAEPASLARRPEVAAETADKRWEEVHGQVGPREAARASLFLETEVGGGDVTIKSERGRKRRVWERTGQARRDEGSAVRMR